MPWDVVVKGREYQVVMIEGYIHAIGGGRGENNLWMYPRDEEPTYENLVEYYCDGCGVCWGIKYEPHNYIRTKWDETECYTSGGAMITRNGEDFYFCRGGIDEAKWLMKHLDEHPLNLNEYGFVEMDDAYSTGSSIMPQKKNPDIAELVRGKTGRVYGALMSMLTTMKGIPLAYNKDMQEDKEMTFDAIDTVKDCIMLCTGMVDTMRFNKKNMEESAKLGFTNATDAADYLVKKGMPFRDAHSVIGRLVLFCIEKNCAIDDLSLEELQSISDVFEADIYEAISLKTCVEKRLTTGAPGPQQMKNVIAIYHKYLEEEEK